MTKPDTAEIERLAAQAPSAVDVSNKQREELVRQTALNRDRADRMLAIQEATKACAVGGYEVGAILALARGFHAFLTETK